MNGMPGLITVDVLAVTRNEHGDRTTTPAGSIPGCGFEPLGSSEDTDNRAQVATTAALYVPRTDVVVTAQHKIRTPDGHVWDVDGDPAWWSNPLTGDRPGGQIRLTRVTG